jgi:hypothetical protein
MPLRLRASADFHPIMLACSPEALYAESWNRLLDTHDEPLND